MKKKKITKILLTILVALVLISPNTVEAKKTCNKITTNNTCSKRGDCSWNKTKKKCSNKACSKIVKKSDCDGTRCNWKNNKCVKSTSNSNILQFCSKTAVIWQIVGWVLLVIKIILPLIIIILASIDFFKAVVSGKDSDIMMSLKGILWRFISAVVIFLLPTIVGIVMSLISNFSDSGAKSEYDVCKTCILDPADCDTSKDVGKN